MSLDVWLNDPAEGQVFDWNITHNLNTMATEAGIYRQLWRPDEIGALVAGDIADALEAGLILLVTQPDRFRAFNPENGWGDYSGLVCFVTEYHSACRKWPKATIGISR